LRVQAWSSLRRSLQRKAPGKMILRRFRHLLTSETVVPTIGVVHLDFHGTEVMDLTVDKEVRPFEFTFRATGIVAKKNRIGFVMGDETGDLIVKEMTLTEKADK